MKFIGKTMLRGLLAILPTAITIYILYWLGSSAEVLLGKGIRLIISEKYYWPGMGLVAGLAVLFLIGILMNAWVFKKLFKWQENLFSRIPLVKTLYTALKDLLSYFSVSQKKTLNQVVAVELKDTNIHLVGFVTGENLSGFPSEIRNEEMVTVYFPMSYQMGGYMAVLPRSSVRPVDMSVQDAFTYVLTAGIIQGEPENEKEEPLVTNKKKKTLTEKG